MNKIKIAAVIAALTLSLAACGGETNNDTSKTENTTTTTTAAAAEESKEESSEEAAEDSSAAEESEAEAPAESEASSVTESEASSETESKAEEDEEDEEILEGMQTISENGFNMEYNADIWLVKERDDLGTMLTYFFNEDDVFNYSYQMVLTIVPDTDIDSASQELTAIYQDSAGFNDPMDYALNGIPGKRIDGELYGDGTAAMADISLIFLKPEGSDDVLVVRYTTIRMCGEEHPEAEQAIRDVLFTISYTAE